MGARVLGRITPSPPKPKPKFVHEVRVSRSEIDRPWLAGLLDRIAGPRGFKKRTPFWSFTILSFPTKEQADEFSRHLRRHRELEEKRDRQKRPCPVSVRYDQAARAQHAVLWGLSTGIIREVVRVYRRERAECSSHGHPNWIASNVIMAAAPTTSRERAREMVDAMLAWTIARHPTCFWNGLQGERIINRY